MINTFKEKALLVNVQKKAPELVGLVMVETKSIDSFYYYLKINHEGVYLHLQICTQLTSQELVDLLKSNVKRAIDRFKQEEAYEAVYSRDSFTYIEGQALYKARFDKRSYIDFNNTLQDYARELLVNSSGTRQALLRLEELGTNDFLNEHQSF